MYTLFLDTDCDITPEIAARYGAKLISYPYILDGKDIKPYVDFEKYDAHAFCQRMREGSLPTTYALSPEDYRAYFEPEFQKGNDVLYIHYSKNLSATFNSIRLLMEDLKEKYPERRLELIDTQSMTLGSLMLCELMGQMYKDGKSIDEIVEWSKENNQKWAMYFFADNLKFFGKSGRVSGFTAFMGGLIGIKPIIYMSPEGKMVSIDKAKGRKNALKKILDYVEKVQDHIQDWPIGIAHGDAMYLVDEFVPMLKERFGENLNIVIGDVNPTACAHCGPDTLGITFHAKHR